MTVCIAAVCNVIKDRPVCLIAAADRMITIGDIEYEPAQTKLVWFATNTVGLFAGDMTFHAAVVPKVYKRIDDALHETQGNINVRDIAEFYAEEFAYHRRQMAERTILVPRGLNFDRYLARQSTMAHWQVNDLDARLASFYIDSTTIIAGIDPSGAHIYKIVDPGLATCFNTPFFTCAGSGEPLATTQFMVSGFEKTWPAARALWLTFTAKARAEMAGGVGSQTDMVVIIPGRSHVLTDSEKEELYRLFKQTEKKQKDATDQAVEEVQKHLESEAAKERAAEDMKQTSAQQPPPADAAPAAIKAPRKRRPKAKKAP